MIIKNTSKGTACILDQHMIVQNLDKIKSRVSKIIIYYEFKTIYRISKESIDFGESPIHLAKYKILERLFY